MPRMWDSTTAWYHVAMRYGNRERYDQSEDQRRGAEASSARLGARGRLVLPAEIRRQLDLAEGDRVLFTVEEPGVLRMTTAREVVRRARGALREAIGDRDLVAELIAERRREAENE